MVEAETTAAEVSVIVPVFNGANYLEEAISSVIGQTVGPGEIIVVDDGSTDATEKVAKMFSTEINFCKRLHAGIGATRNHGISIARGRWLAFLDADDVWLPDKLLRQLSFARKNPAVQIIFGGIEQFISPELDGEERCQLELTLEKTSAPHCGTMLARREVFERIGRFDTTVRAGEFIDWFARARDAGIKIATINEIVMRRRWHRSNLSRSNRNAFSDLAGILKKAMDRRREPGLDL